jgi:hypothetical protein
MKMPWSFKIGGGIPVNNKRITTGQWQFLKYSVSIFMNSQDSIGEKQV